MAVERETLRDWHRLFGLFLMDFFTDSPFSVEVERDLSEQQQFLDVVVLRCGRGQFTGRLPDGFDGLTTHNLISFKSHHEALDGWAMKELVGHYVAYRKLVSPSPSRLLAENQFRLYAVCARFPHNLSGQVPWNERQAGVYDCQWGTDTVRVIVAGQLPQEEYNAPLHLFSASPELVSFGQRNHRRRSERSSGMIQQLFERYEGEGFTMSYTMADFERDSLKRQFAKLTPQERRDFLQSVPPRECRAALECLPLRERRELLQSLPPEDLRQVVESLPPEERLAGLPLEERLAGLPLEDRLAGLSEEQIRQYLEQRTADQSAKPRKQRRKR